MRRSGPEGNTIKLWQSPIGWIGLAVGSEGLIDIVVGRSRAHAAGILKEAHPAAAERPHPLIERAVLQLEEYFSGKRRHFDLPLDYRHISPFARRILRVLALSAYGTTLSYGELAGQVGHPGAARAVGGVMAANRWPIIIPCHRVLGKDGNLTGYSGGRGLETKKWLLGFEKKQLERE